MGNTREWRKSSYSSGVNNNCVEVAGGTGTVSVRDTQNRGLGKIDFTSAAWASFLRDLKDGRL
ncbi:DUF397 domain-containing protein [Actinorugispora endophytica]|uniref:Uncharacterized protein DUF397 n=1 Tax=Actinorugispora endophytica TaxID=1605990 RepID=A0A4R6V719_9ACTN|nr:DUF397 domain-containing protein [Actinorugispora endophytica]TDQ54317.1 uncharacterized protein DUF397 [Actinorugispora endophytica]